LSRRFFYNINMVIFV